MKITSLALQTDLIFARFNGEVLDRGGYVVVRTPDNPDFHWGNFLIFDEPPSEGALIEWRALFDGEFREFAVSHYAFTWQQGTVGQRVVSRFTDAGFRCAEDVTLATGQLVSPEHFNQALTIRKAASDDDWQAMLDCQLACRDPAYEATTYARFKRKQMSDYRLMSEQGLGDWYGAWQGKHLAGCLGIYRDGALARYQLVATHPDFRGQGVCQTLVNVSGQHMLDAGVTQLVMVADPGYHAARLYEAAGFRRVEIQCLLSWWQDGDDS